MKIGELLGEGWSEKYKRSINCKNPKGFSQRAHCAGRRKDESSLYEDGQQGLPIVYLDMDGVLADFHAGYIDLFGYPPKKNPDEKVDDPDIAKLMGTDFFATLPKLPGADKLVAACVELFGGYSICSSPLRNDHANSEKNKKLWISKHLNPQPDNIVITRKKDSYAKGRNILVDDKPKNIDLWRSRGGVGILYNGYTENVGVVIKQLRNLAAQYR